MLIFCIEVSLACRSGGLSHILSDDCRSRSVFHCWQFCLSVCSYLTFKADFPIFKEKAFNDYVVITMSSLLRIRVENLGWTRFPQDWNPKVVSNLFSQSCIEWCPEMLTGNYSISHCGSGVGGHLGLNSIKEYVQHHSLQVLEFLMEPQNLR